jgi:hypothetical protein
VPLLSFQNGPGTAPESAAARWPPACFERGDNLAKTVIQAFAIFKFFKKKEQHLIIKIEKSVVY